MLLFKTGFPAHHLLTRCFFNSFCIVAVGETWLQLCIPFTDHTAKTTDSRQPARLPLFCLKFRAGVCASLTPNAPIPCGISAVLPLSKCPRPCFIKRRRSCFSGCLTPVPSFIAVRQKRHQTNLISKKLSVRV